MDRWTAGPAMRVCPAARHQPLVPAQQRSRTDRESRPRPARHRATQRRQEQPIRLSQLLPPRLPAQDRELVPQHKDLQLLRPRRTAADDNQFEQTANDQVRKRPQHTRPPTDGKASYPAATSTTSPTHVTEFSNPTRSGPRPDPLQHGPIRPTTPPVFTPQEWVDYLWTSHSGQRPPAEAVVPSAYGDRRSVANILANGNKNSCILHVSRGLENRFGPLGPTKVQIPPPPLNEAGLDSGPAFVSRSGLPAHWRTIGAWLTGCALSCTTTSAVAQAHPGLTSSCSLAPAGRTAPPTARAKMRPLLRRASATRSLGVVRPPGHTGVPSVIVSPDSPCLSSVA